MRALAFILCCILSLSVQAQINQKAHARGWHTLLFGKKSTVLEGYSRTTSPSLTSLPASSSAQTGSGYWQGSSYRTISEDGRFESYHFFDVLGNLRESKASISLKKSGGLSYWHLQISPQRSRPWVSYTIH